MQNDFQSLTIYEDPNVIASNYYISSSPSPLFYPPITYLPHMLSQPITQSFTPITLPSQPFHRWDKMLLYALQISCM